ncbi:MAG: hypothetical protein K2X77_23235 [Candidatus Obscuribacterales bacterium]|jgi:hypothetical protein|nr:hypothetical protein [Candidatus Obscuribacterales bacterium]
MDKVFSWPVLVGICGVFLAVWVALQFLSTMRLQEEAKEIGVSVYSWNWPGENWQSSAEMTQAEIVHRTDNDAVVKVSGKQTLKTSGGEKNSGNPLDISKQRSETVDCSVTLTLYRQGTGQAGYQWVLGRVEL